MDAETELAMRVVYRDESHPNSPAVTLPNGDRFFPPGVFDREIEDLLQGFCRRQAEKDFREKVRADVEFIRNAFLQIEEEAAGNPDVSDDGGTDMKPGDGGLVM